jgi:hypothetical protein
MSTTRDIIRAALDETKTDALVTARHAGDLADEIAEALEAAGYTLKKKPAPRKPAEPVEAFAPNTGSPELDAFMTRKHAHNWREKLKKALARTRPGMMTMPTPPPGHAPKPMTQQERADLWRDHKVQQHSS